MNILEPPLNVAVGVCQTLVEIEGGPENATIWVSAMALKLCPQDLAVIARADVAASLNRGIALLNGVNGIRSGTVDDFSVDSDELLAGWGRDTTSSRRCCSRHGGSQGWGDQDGRGHQRVDEGRAMHLVRGKSWK